MKNKKGTKKHNLIKLAALSKQDVVLERIAIGRHQTQKALHESIKLYETLLEISPDAITLVDLDAKIIMANQQAVKLHAFCNMEELIEKNAFELIDPKDRTRAKKNMDKTIKLGGLKNIEYNLLKKDGTSFLADVSVSVIKDVNDKPAALMCVLRDISERKQAQEALIESELLFRTITESAISGVYIIHNDKFSYVNPAVAKMFGYRPDEIIGKMGPLDLTHPEDKHLVTKQMMRRMNGEIDKVRYAFRGVCKNGTVIYCESLGRTIEIQGQVMIMGTLLDITARTKMLEELQYKVDLEKLITSLSTKFINLRSNEIAKGVNVSLKMIAEFAGVDRSYIFLYRDKGKKMDNVYEWCAPGIKPHINRLQDLDTDAFAWFHDQIKRTGIVYVPKVTDLPAKAKAEKDEWTLENIKSLINIPMVFQGTVIGFIGFDSVREEKQWSSNIHVLLRIVGQMFANIITHRQTDKNIEMLNKELMKTNLKLKQLALRDAHTGLYNHNYFKEAIESEFMRAKRHGEPLSIILLDIDYFKSINDVYGHYFGDLVLKQLAKLFTKMVRKYDRIIRYGGEEFLIITPGADRNIAMVLARRLWEVIKLQDFGDKKHKVKLKLSMAVVSYPEDNVARGVDFIEIADDIVNKAKESGGDRVYSSLDVKKRGDFVAGEKDDTDVKFLKDKLDKLTKRANQSLAEAIFAFAKTIEIKDHYTGKHVEKTVHYATEIAKIYNLPKEEVERIKEAAILHDLGKIGVREKTLRKKTQLTKKEYEEIKRHPQIGADILRPIHFFQKIIPLILYHHEHWDGRGYPYGLKHEEIPLGARIIAVADTYEALTSNRRYRKACSREQAIKKIKNAAGTQLDPKTVMMFLEVLKQERDNY